MWETSHGTVPNLLSLDTEYFLNYTTTFHLIHNKGWWYSGEGEAIQGFFNVCLGCWVGGLF